MVRFKIGFEIGAETLFGMLSKMLPIDNLSVEEIVPIKTERVITGVKAHPQIRSPTARKKRHSNGLDLKKGINGVMLAVLNDGQPHRATELRPLVKAAGFSSNSVGSRLQALREKGVVKQIGDGTWRLAGE